jgi:hypothetical protein
VYVEDASSSAVSVTGVTGGALVIVGPGLGYRTATESIPAFSTVGAEASLSNRGVYTADVTGPPAIAKPVVTRADGTVLVEGDDYQWVVDTSGGGGASNAVTSLRRKASGGTPTDVNVASPAGVINGEYVVVKYRYTDPLYFTPQLFTDFDLLEQVYGASLVSTSGASVNSNQVLTPLSMAARVAFEQGVSEVLCVATNPADGNFRAQFVAAYAKLLSDYRVGVIVPLFVDGYVTGVNTSNTAQGAAFQGYVTDLAVHINTSVSQGFPRIAMVGMPRNYDETSTAIDAMALSIKNKRIALVFPYRAVYYNGLTNQTGEVDGLYVAAALGGQLLVNPVQRGLTKIAIRSFAGIPSGILQRMTKSFMDLLSKSGVLVLQRDRAGRLSVRHGITTDVSSMTTREISIIRIADTLFQNIQQGMDNANLIGEPIDEEMPTRVKGALQGILESARLDDVIVAWDNLVVRQQSSTSGDPSVIECKFSYKPAVPLNYIAVSFTIDLTAGTIETTNNDNTQA